MQRYDEFPKNAHWKKTPYNSDLKADGSYAGDNVAKVEDICSKFSGSIENNVLLVCNQMQLVENSTDINPDAMKSS